MMSDVKFNETFEEIFPNGLDYSDVGQGGICSLNVEQIQFVVESATSHDPMVDRIRVLEEALNRISSLTNNFNIINAKQIADQALGNEKKQ